MSTKPEDLIEETSEEHLATMREQLLGWYATHKRELPWHLTNDPYAILVAEIMLQQTQASRVTPKYLAFLSQFPTWQALAAATSGEVIRAWGPLGYNRRAVRLQRIAQQVVSRYGGCLPREQKELEKLEGLGPYTVAAMACFAFGQNVPVLDTNIRRVLGRLFFGAETPPERNLSAIATRAVPQEGASDWNQALMDLGATLCRPRNPCCPLCPLRRFCRAATEATQNTAKVAELRHSYKTNASPFRGSRRYYRGRIVDVLRGLPGERHLALEELGQEVKSDFHPEDLPWLRGLLQELQREGLVALMTPDPETQELRVSLP